MKNYHGNGEFQFIGTLQPNKVKYIIDKVTLIHAVDRYSLLKEIEKQAAKKRFRNACFNSSKILLKKKVNMVLK